MENKFCDKCGKLLKIEIRDAVKLGVCSCGFEKEIPEDSSIKFSDKSKKKEKKGEGVALPEKRKGFPHLCTKCGNDDADAYDLGAQYSDECNVLLFRCKKCGNTTRQSDGTGN